MTKSFIHIKDFTRQEIYEIFELADKIADGTYGSKILQGKTIVLFFPEASIRTRVTFEKGIHQLGGDTILFPPTALDKREKTEDVMKYLANWVDAAVVRHRDLTLLERMAECSDIPVINAMTSGNHPCEILADMYSISKIYSDFTQKKFLFVGGKGNIGNSWKAASELMGFEIEQCCPKGYEIENMKVHHSVEEAISGKDVICTDSIPQNAREAFGGYQVTLQHMNLANPGAILNPCPPFYRGEEVSEEVINSKYFVGYEFKKHLLEVQQAIICYLLQKARS